MLIEADFSNIAIGFPLLPAGDYRCVIDEIKSDATADGKPQVVFELSIIEGEFKGQKVFDRLTMRTNKGEVNKISYGRIKEFGIATLGEEAANSTNGIDTEAMKGSTVIVVVTQESYDKKDKTTGALTGEKGTSNKIARVLAA